MTQSNPQINMIKQQVQTWGVNDETILNLLEQIPRDHFTPQEYRSLAYADIQVPLAHGEYMLSPQIEAKSLSLLGVQPGDSVLEIGTGSGYFTALLARLANTVTTVDYYEDFPRKARQKHKALGIYNIRYECGNAAYGLSKYAPYDVIVLTGGLYQLPRSLKKELKPGGRLFAFIGQPPAMEGSVITRTAENAFTSKTYFETVVPYLHGGPQPPAFTF